MNWEETLIIPSMFYGEEVDWMGNLKGQAKTSFGWGRQDGIREVTDWIKRQAVIAPFHEGQPDTMYWQMSTEDWQAKLKEWRLDERSSNH